MDFVNFGEIETKYKIVLACLARDQTGVVIQNQKHQYFPIYFLDLKKKIFLMREWSFVSLTLNSTIGTRAAQLFDL